MNNEFEKKAIAALERLLVIAKTDSGQAGRVATFLLSWWNAGTCGGFDMTDLWAVASAITNDMIVVFAQVGAWRVYPDRINAAYRDDFQDIIQMWRPALLEEA